MPGQICSNYNPPTIQIGLKVIEQRRINNRVVDYRKIGEYEKKKLAYSLYIKYLTLKLKYLTRAKKLTWTYNAKFTFKVVQLK